MRSSFFRFLAPLVLALPSAAPAATAIWDFSNGSSTPATVPLFVFGGPLTASQLQTGTLTLGTTAASGGYAGASGGMNATVRTVSGPLSPATSTFIEFTLTAPVLLKLTATSLSLGSRSSASGPNKFTLFSSADQFATPVATIDVPANGEWSRISFGAFQVTTARASPLTFRIFAGGGSAPGAEWRVDDVLLTFTTATITSQPAFQSAPLGETVTFSVGASGAGALSYQWRKDGEYLPGATNADLVLVAISAGAVGTYDVLVSDNSGAIRSAPAPLAIGPVLAAPVITTEPLGYTSVIGQSISLTAGASGTPPPSFQWTRDGVPLVGRTEATLVIPSAALSDRGHYGFVATNSAGSAAINPVFVDVTKQPQTISMPVPPPLPFGASVTLEATASSGLPVTFRMISGTGTLVGNVLTSNGGTVVIRASQPGDAHYAAATLDRVFTFLGAGTTPFLSGAPADQTVTAGESVTWRGAAIGTPAPTYQWFKDGAPLAGATGTTLGLSNVSLADAGRYTFAATNAIGEVRATAVLTVRSAPVIRLQPASTTIDAGAGATLRVEADGFPAPSYQWQRNGEALPGATGSSFVLGNARSSDAGQYQVVVRNELGSIVSAAATLTVQSRAFAGTYFGQFSGATGNFALHVRGDGSAVFIGHLPSLRTGLVIPDLQIERDGTFLRPAQTLAIAAAIQYSDSEFGAPDRGAAAQAVSLRGTLDSGAGTVDGEIAELGASLAGTRSPPSGAAAAQAGFYDAVLIGSGGSRGYIVVGADGRALVFTASASTLDSATGNLGTDGRLRLATASQATIDLGFTSGRVSGTVRVSGAVVGTISGVWPELAGGERLVNLAVRTGIAPGVTSMTGFVITGEQPKQVLIRASGPAIGGPPFNVANALANPTIQLLRGSTVLAQNDDWGAPAAEATVVSTAAGQAGAFPYRNGSRDAALVRTLPAGAYTVTVGGGTGVVLAEIYEVLEGSEAPGGRRLVNLSARGSVSAASPLIAGFVLAGTAPQRVLIRGIGPALAAAPFNVAGALADPQLTLFRGNTPLKSNSEWFRDPEAALIRSTGAAAGAFPLGAQSADAAMLVYLEPGAYTAVVTGPPTNPNASGIALVEIYAIDR